MAKRNKLPIWFEETRTFKMIESFKNNLNGTINVLSENVTEVSNFLLFQKRIKICFFYTTMED